MSLRNLESIMFVEEPPEFDYRDGMFFIRQRFSDDCVIERAMRPHVFMLSLRRAAEAAGKHFGSAKVIPFDKEDREAAH